MSRRRKLIILLVSILPVVVFVVAAFVFLIAQIQRAVQQVDVLLVDALERETQRQVEVGKITVRPLGRVEIEDLRIEGGPRIEGETLLSASKVIVNYRLSDLITGRVAPIQSVSSIRIIEPDVLLQRSEDGVWNIADLLRPRPPGPPFTGVVMVKRGTVTLRDHQSLLPEEPSVNQVTNLDAVFDAAEAPSYLFEATARGTQGRINDVRVLGSGNADTGVWRVDIAAANADAAYWTNYFTEPDAIRPVAGRMDASVTVGYRGDRPPDQRTTISGTATVRDGVVAVDSLREPVRQLAGNVVLTTTVATLSLQGALARSPITLDGTIVDFDDARLNINIFSERMDYGALRDQLVLPARFQDIRASGVGALRLLITGDASSPIVQAVVSIPTVTALGYQARNLNAAVAHQEGQVRVTSLTAGIFGGRVALSGSVFINQIVRLDLTGRASGIPLRAFRLPADVTATGVASGTFAVTGTTDQPQMAINAQVGPGMLDGLRFSQASGRFVLTQQRIRIDGLNVATAGGVIRAAGVISDARLQLDVSASGVDLAALMNQFNITGYEGRAYLRGVVSGTLSNPAFTGRAEIFNGRFGQIAFDYARGRIVATRNDIALTDATLRVVPSEIIVTGRITGLTTDRPEVDLALRVSEAQATQVLRLLQITADVTGLVSGNLRVVGTLPDVAVAGEVVLRDGSVVGFPVTNAVASIEYLAGTLTLRNMIAQTDGATLVASGTIDSAQQIDISFTVSELSLAYFNRFTRPYVVLGGTAGVLTGVVTGTVDDPAVRLATRTDNITINTERFSEMRFALDWAENRIAVREFALERDGQLLAVNSLAFDQRTEAVALSGSLTCMHLSTLLGTFYESSYVREVLAEPADSAQAQALRTVISALPTPTEAVFSVTFAASGTLPQLETSFRGVIADLTLGQAQIAQVDLAIRTENGMLIVDDLTAIARDATITVQPGVVYADGQLDIDLAVANFDVATLGTLAGRQDTRGVASIDASIEGPVASPVIVASIEVAQPEIAGIAFDRIRASRIEVGADAITLSDIIFTSNGYSAVAYGTIPWDWEQLTVPDDRPLDVHAALREQDLAVLAMLTAAIGPEGISGRVEAVLDVTGTIAEPDISGFFTITDGRLELARVGTPLEDIQARIVFDQDRLVVEQFTGRSAAGGTFAILPEGQLSLRREDGLPIDMALQTQGLVVRARDLLGYGESIAVTVASDLTLTGTFPSPVVAGDITIRGGSFAVAPPAILPHVEREITFNPQFDVNITVGPDIEFLNPRIRTFIAGAASVVGTLSQPTVRGEFQLPRGEIRLPTTRFRLQPGSTVVLDYSPPDTARISPNIEGRTRLTAVSPLGTRRQYTIIMSVTGSLPPAENMRIALASDPPDLAESRILALLGHAEDLFNGGEFALREELMEIFTAVAIPSLFDPLETAFLEAFGLTEFEIEYSLRQPLAFLVSREIAPNLYASYWRSITAQDVDYWFRISYEIFGRYRLSYVDSPRAGSTLEANVTYRF